MCGCKEASKARIDYCRTKAAMCASCPNHVTDDTGSVSRCGARLNASIRINGEASEWWSRGECPRGRFPDADGVVRWSGVRWYGVPAPIRWWLRWRNPVHPKPSSFPGCGCIKRLKDAIGGRHG